MTDQEFSDKENEEVPMSRNWRDSVKEFENRERLKISDGDSLELTFDEKDGREYYSKFYGKSFIIFNVIHEGQKKFWKIDKHSAGTLRQIISLGTNLKGIKVSVHRMGKMKATRYTIKKVEE